MDITFSLANLITIGGGIIATLTAFLKLQYDQKAETKATIVRFETMEREHEKEVESLKSLITHNKNGKHAMKKELTALIEKEALVTKNRIDSTQKEMKENQAKTDAEFKEINGKLSEIIGYVKR